MRWKTPTVSVMLGWNAIKMKHLNPSSVASNGSMVLWLILPCMCLKKYRHLVA